MQKGKKQIFTEKKIGKLKVSVKVQSVSLSFIFFFSLSEFGLPELALGSVFTSRLSRAEGSQSKPFKKQTEIICW